MKDLPTLYHLGKNGALYSWDVWTEGPVIHSRTGQVGGQMIPSSKIATPKNVGRANATTAEEQAIREAQAMHKHKLDRKYSLTPEEARQEDIQPMLAHKFQDKKKKVQYPGDMQPKLDGARALAYWDGDQVILTSRGAQVWTVPQHINRELEGILPKGCVLDGELYVHGVEFNTIMSWVKRKQPDTLRLEYHVYDMPSFEGEDSLPWAVRRDNLAKFFIDNQTDKIKHVPAETVLFEDEVDTFHEKCVVENGYEGAIYRNHDGLYTYGYRSPDLLKVKAFDDGEFKVVGYTNGVGKFANCAIFICHTPDGKEFKAVPKGKMEYRQQLLRDAEQYIGKLLTVEYFGVSEDGIPRFPVGKGFRLAEDISK